MVNKPVGKMYVLKRGGRKEEVHLDKITSRVQKLCYDLNMDFVDPVSITLKVVNGLYTGVTTTELDTLAAETAITKTDDHPDYATLAARIAISNLHKETKKQFSEVIDMLYNVVDDVTKKRTPKISEEHHQIIMKNADRLNSCIIYDRDFAFNYFGFKILEQSYLHKINGKVVERPQHMLMRVAVGIHGEDIEAAIATYNLLSERYYYHMCPTLYSAATPHPQLCSSFLMMMQDDSINGIFTCLRRCGMISKFGEGIGFNIHNIRASGTYIAGTNGISNGLVPMLRVYDNSAQYIRNLHSENTSSIAVYIEPWHADIFEFLNLGKPTGKDEMRARSLSYALWVPDLFMKRVQNNENWSLMCPHKSAGLSDSWGEDFIKLYEKYEAEGNFIKQVPAQDLWKAVIVSQVESGGPYILYKDACNKKSNQQHVGTIKCGNFTTEAIGYTSPEEIAVCSQAVISLGIGVQGLADTFILLRIPFYSDEAAQLNKKIFETLYYGALEASCELAEKYCPYPTYEGSPVSKGTLQYEMWGSKPSDLWNWSQIKEKISKSGVRNSLLISQMPTSSTAQIWGNSESVEPYRSNIYSRRVASGEYHFVNEQLLRDLTEKGIWDDTIKQKIIDDNGSVQNISEIPNDLKEIYKTSWEMSQKVILNMAADRAPFIDQSQCLNIHMQNPSYGSLSSMHFYGWQKGLKTGLFSLRTKPAPKNVQLAVQKNKSSNPLDQYDSVEAELKEIKRKLEEEEEKNMAGLVCSLKNPEACEMCGS
ncbi:hypothetical protein JTB14_001628 [Gonioctena quinquepunctata]|nr:hypothetical protein JTB14_001628 [Gonioctena quinquepunctata]